jgi:ATP-dependent DNA helicase RecQ
VPDDVLAAATAVLQHHFGYPGFRPAQRRVVHGVLSGHDTLVVLATGGGKSLCFQVPALVLHGLTIVVSPLISLMTDQVDALTRRGIAAACLTSTLPPSVIEESLTRAECGELKLLYVAPERCDSARTIARLTRTRLALLAIDEAHCISEWGHEFRPSYRRLSRVREALGTPTTIALTATATPRVRDDIVRQLALRDPRVIVSTFDRPNLSYEVIDTRRQSEKHARLVAAVRTVQDPVVVYAPTRSAVERTARLIRQRGVPAAAYHAGLPDDVRQAAQDDFMRDRVRVIAATNAFGMGVDKPNVRLVIHLAMPGSLEAYYQEAGRAGRDGRPGHCVLLHAPDDRHIHEAFFRRTHPPRQVVERVIARLRALAEGEIVPIAASALERAMLLSFEVGAIRAALELLRRSELIRDERGDDELLHVQLFATPRRIDRELSAGSPEHRLAAWFVRQSTTAASTIAVPRRTLPDLGAPRELAAVLDRLQSRQFLAWSRAGAGTRLHPSLCSDPDSAIDWSALEHRQRVEREKLDAMEGYALTRRCRRAYVLRYFGDDTRRDRCHGCDNCRG